MTNWNGKVPDTEFAPRFRILKVSWGHFGVVFAGRDRLLGTFLPDGERAIRKSIGLRFAGAVEDRSGMPSLCDQIQEYFCDRRPCRKIKVDWGGVSDFRRRVYEACQRIPFGATGSYRDLARAAGCPDATRAAGTAMACNPLPLIVPCHRVIRSDGSLGGFSCPQGPANKMRLLLHENPRFRFRGPQSPRDEIFRMAGKSSLFRRGA